MITLAFLFGLCIATVGAIGAVAPSSLIWIAQHAVTSTAFYIVAIVRVAFGLTTAVMGLLGIERAQAFVDWWLQQGAGVVRLTGVLILALGGFVAYACAPPRLEQLESHG